MVLLPAGHVAVGKIAQALMHGAKVISIRGNFDRALEMVHEPLPHPRVVSAELDQPLPAGRTKTIGFEAIDQLGCVPDRHFALPVG